MQTSLFEQDRRAILTAALPSIQFDGWTMDTLRRGAAAAGLGREAADRVFPEGPAQAVECWNRIADEAMQPRAIQPDFAALRVHEKIEALAMARLRHLQFQREAIRRGLALYALPQHYARSLRTLWHTADATWRLAGDTSTDYNHYTKRLLLSGVLASTLYAYLDDETPELAETQAFLQRRLRDVLKVGKHIQKVKDGARQTGQFLPPTLRKAIF